MTEAETFMSQLVTLKDIAAKTGVSVATVSLALNQHPRISRATTEKVRRAAQELRYRPNAMMSMFSSYRKTKSLDKFQAKLGWIDCWQEAGEMFRSYRSTRGYFEGAWKRAEELGFQLEIFRLHAAEMTETRLSKILYSRGIQGLLIPPMEKVGASLRLDWRQFSAVTFSNSLAWPNLHRISFSSITASLLAMVKLWEIGYRRIAYCPKIVKNPFGLVDMGFLGGYLSILCQLPDLAFLQPFDTRAVWGKSNETAKASFLAWMEKCQPDALLCQDFPMPLEWLQEAGYEIPRDLGYADTWIAAYDQPVAGVDTKPETMGGQAVDFLVGMMRRHETGIPRDPVQVMSDCVWVNGPTTKSQPPRPKNGRDLHIEEELFKLIRVQKN